MELDLPPGVLKTDSPSAAIGRYIDTEWSRFLNGKPEKVGGFIKQSDGRIIGAARGLHAYVNTEGFVRIGVGTNTNLYGVDDQGEIGNITPIRSTDTLTDPFTTTDGSADVVVAHTSHDAIKGDTVRFSGAGAVGGITLDGDYQIFEVEADAYTVTHSSAATSDATGGGTVEAQYEINIGGINGTQRAGFGAGAFGDETFGTPRTINLLSLSPRFWSLGNYGRVLIGTPTRGTIYLYNDVTDDRAEALANAPTDVLYVFVTEERFIMALRQGMYVQWPDQDDPTAWTPTITNTANTRRLAEGAELVAGSSLANGVAMIWTTTAAYLLQYTGGSFVYDSRLAGTECGLIGQNAFAVNDGAAYWMSYNGFHAYAGFVGAIPRSAEVRDWVFRNINRAQAAKSTAFYNARFREVWFIFPAGESLEPNRYVMVNLDDYSWCNGSLARVGHTSMAGEQSYPIMASFDGEGGYLFQHETGVDADGESLPWRLQTGLIRTSDSGKIIDIMGFAPDFDRIAGTITLTVDAKDRPRSTQIDSEANTFDDESEMVDYRVSGRHVAFTLEQDEIGGDYRMGVPIIETQLGGERR